MKLLPCKLAHIGLVQFTLTFAPQLQILHDIYHQGLISPDRTLCSCAYFE